jgi:predicted  nucleic acid-binding Zn-ribbon protein
MSQAPTLITNAETAAMAVKTAADDFVGWLSSVRADIQKIEDELAQKRRAADTEVARLRAELEKLRSERDKAERELAAVRKEVAKERAEIGQERARLLRTVEGVLGAA